MKLFRYILAIVVSVTLFAGCTKDSETTPLSSEMSLAFISASRSDSNRWSDGDMVGVALYSDGVVVGVDNIYYNVILHRKGLEIESSNIINWNDSDETYASSSVSYDYVIYSESDLVGLNEKLDGTTPLSVILMDDLTIASSNWTPLGDSSSPFIGTFDGNGKSISGLKIDDTSSSYQGLFKVVGDGINDTEIKNLTINDPEIIGGDHLGGIAGISYNSTFTYCSVVGGVITGANYTGGIVGTASSTMFFNCTNSSTSEDSTTINPIAGAIRDGSMIVN